MSGNSKKSAKLVAIVFDGAWSGVDFVARLHLANDIVVVIVLERQITYVITGEMVVAVFIAIR